MSNIVTVDFRNGSSMTSTIDMSALRSPRRQLDTSLIAPAESKFDQELANEHAAEPLKNVDDIERISQYLVSEGRYRDNMLFIVGINFGLRVSDLLTLRFGHLIDDSFRFKTTFPILEKKTKKTRKVKKNRYITINDAVMDAVTLYLEHHPSKLDDYMFKGEGNRSGHKNEPMHRNQVERILKGVVADLGIEVHASTHMLRKTFAYHQMMMSGNSPRKLLLLQKMFGHSSTMQTLDYIGLTMEEMQEAYAGLNLGSKSCYNRFSDVGECDVV